MQRIFRKIIDTVIMLAIILSLVDVCASSNLNGQIIGWLLAVIVILGYLAFLTRRKLTKWFPLSNKFTTFLNSKWLFIGLMLIYQLILLIGLSGETGFDTGIVKWGASTKNIVDGSYLDTYFSHNPNNIALLFAERAVFHFTGAAYFTITLDIINLLLVDLAILLVAMTLKHHLQHPLFWSLLPVTALISPWIVVVYSDTVVLPFISGMILLIDSLIQQFQTHSKWSTIMLTSALLGIITWASYALKITTIIVLIALVLELCVQLLKKSATFSWSRFAVAVSAFVIAFGLFYGGNKIFLNHQQVISIDKNITELPSHYIMMGMNKDTLGGYSQKDFLISTQQPTKKAQQKANITEIKNRLNNFGTVGYIHFLFVKHAANISDGTLGWLKEGNFFNTPNFNRHPLIRSFFYPGGTRLSIYQTFAQLLWIIMFIGVLFSFGDRSLITRVLRMSLFGIFVYLLFFEGGRSRYIIQFLPVITILSVIGWHQLRAIIAQRVTFKINLKFK